MQIAFYSQVPFMATVQYINDCLEYCCFWGNYQISATEDVQLLSMDEIMDMADLYASCGMINPPETRDEIYEIEMQYYLEEMDGKVTFRPIWNFKVQQINPGGASPTGNGCDFFYLDAQDGTLVDYRGY